jgi:transposase
MPLDRLPCCLWTTHHGLQSLQSLEPTRPVPGHLRYFGADRAQGYAVDRQHLDQGAAIGWRRKRGPAEQAIGRSRGGRTTKIHAITDSQGRLFRFSLTPGNVADITEAYRLAEQLPSNGCLIGDMGYDALELRQQLAFRGTASVIPSQPTRKHPWPLDTETYKERNLVERGFSRLKDFRRIATRYDKLARNFASTIALAAVVTWWT